MKFNLKFMREFLKFFRTTEENAKDSDSPVFNTKEVGKITIVTPEKRLSFSLAVMNEERNSLNTAWMIKTVKGEFIIVFHVDHFLKLVFDNPTHGDFHATIAHEVGHYLVGHFEKEANGNVDIRPEVQSFFFNRYQADQSEANEVAYMRSVFFALIKGGVIIRELEADIMALQFVDIADLVHIHTDDFRNKDNVFAVVEKVNRIRRLNKFVSENVIDRTGYSLIVELFDPSTEQK